MPKIKRSPWGWNILLFRTKRFWFKILWVLGDGRTSLQYHQHRTEWYVGTNYKKLVWDRIDPYQEHRVTRGFYFEIAKGLPTEEDIVRIEDDYGRI